jgi:hypothetical protein
VLPTFIIGLTFLIDDCRLPTAVEKPFVVMMQSPVSTIITSNCRATYALEELTRNHRSSCVEIGDRRKNGESFGSIKKTNSTHSLDDLFHSIILISDHPYHFPAIEWSFEDDDSTDRIAGRGNDVTLDKELFSQFDEQRRALNTERFPQLIRCTAHTNLDEFHLHMKPKSSANAASILSK